MNRSNEPGHPRSPADDFELIHQYTRAEAIEDGVLVDLSGWSKECGFIVPVACTRSVWERWIVPSDPTRQLGQSERGRAHDVLFLLLHAIRRSPGAGSVIHYEVSFLTTAHKHERVPLKAVCGPGDSGEAVITIMLPNED